MTQQYRPLIPVDPQGLDDIAEGLLNTSPPNVEANDFAPNKNGFIYVPSINLYVAKERSLQGLNWSNTHDELKKQNLSMPTIHQFREFLKYLRSKEHWQAGLSDRHGYEVWKKEGGADIVRTARDKAREILKTHRPQELTPGKHEKLSRIIQDFEESCKDE